MAPDLNSVPVSPRPGITSAPSHTSTRQPSTPASRRASQVHHMSPPPLPLASPGGTLPASHASHTHAFPPLSPGLSDAAHAPMRHPRSLTAAELHLELEKEQEAVVNRLTRELSQLRAHSASVASTVSSVTSGGAGGVSDADLAPGNAGVHLPPSSSSTAAAAAAAARRERRSSSSASRYSFGIPVPPNTSASSGQNRSQRHSVSSQQGQGQGSGNHGVEMRRSSSIVSTPRYEEVAQQQAVLEEVKRENEVLKERIRELERAIRGRGGDEGERGRRGAPGGEGGGVGGSAGAGAGAGVGAATATTTA